MKKRGAFAPIIFATIFCSVGFAAGEAQSWKSSFSLEKSWSNSSDDRFESTEYLDVESRSLSKTLIDLSFLHSYRFGSTNSSLSGKLGIQNSSGLFFSFGVSALAAKDGLAFLPNSSFMAGVEHPLAGWGSGISELETRSYSDSRVHLLSYAVAIEKLPFWILMPKVVLSQANFTASKETAFTAAAGFQVLHHLGKWTPSLSVTDGREAYPDFSGVVTTEIHSAGASLKYIFSEHCQTWVGGLWENRPNLHRSSQQISLGLEVPSW